MTSNPTCNSFPGTASGPVVQAGSIGGMHLHVTSQNADAVGLILHQLPPPASVFVNQSATLDALDAGLSGGGRLFVLTGMGCIGKTCLAVRFIHRRLELFPDGQLYAHLHGDTGGPAARIPESGAERFALLRTVLHGRRCALLLDSARAASQIVPLLPSSPDCVVVVTSTRRLSALLLYGAAHLELHPLPPECSRTLLGKLIGAERLDGGADPSADLLGLCGGLPLAVAVAAARILARQRRSLARLVREITQVGRGLGALTVGDSVARVVDLAYAELSTTAARLYRAMGRCRSPL